MAAAAAVPPGGRAHGMLSVVGLGDADIERLCDEARQQLGGDTVCQLANYLFPQVMRYHTCCVVRYNWITCCKNTWLFVCWGWAMAAFQRPSDEARQQLGGDTVCQLANYLFPQVNWYRICGVVWYVQITSCKYCVVVLPGGGCASCRLTESVWWGWVPLTVRGPVKRQQEAAGRGVPAGHGQSPLPTGKLTSDMFCYVFN
jgi:hypothetical protein